MTSTQRTAGDRAERFQVSTEAAEVYEARFVPAIFGEWAPLLTTVAGVAPEASVLDVACGTGVVARTVADLQGGDGRVVGVDLNEGMLAVARRVRPDLEWRPGDVAALPFPDRSFDVVLCQMALMFFPDRTAALREMARVTRPGGTVALCVPAALEDQPAYGPFVEMAVEHAGAEARTLLGSYWSCGDLGELVAWLTAAGLDVTDTWTHRGTARFDSAEVLAATEVEGSPLAGLITPDVYDRIRVGAREVLAPFAGPDGSIAAPLRGHLLAARTRED
jgi:SAM-dependent methyltransferase